MVHLDTARWSPAVRTHPLKMADISAAGTMAMWFADARRGIGKAWKAAVRDASTVIDAGEGVSSVGAGLAQCGLTFEGVWFEGTNPTALNLTEDLARQLAAKPIPKNARILSQPGKW